MALNYALITPHVPSICHEDKVPDFQSDMVQGMKEVAKRIQANKPDAIVLVSCHWPSTFNHYVDVTPEHKGMLTAIEAPDLISDVPYYYPGDYDLGMELVQAGQAGGIPVLECNDPYYVWDYGTVVPLRYYVPDEDVPVVNLSVTLAASLEETFKWGEIIGDIIRKSDKNIVFMCSGALSHNLVRGRDSMPTLSEQAMNNQFVDFLMNQKFDKAYEMLPQYARVAGVESGGRHVAMLLGVLKDEFPNVKYYADGQSSGSWNPVITFDR